MKTFPVQTALTMVTVAVLLAVAPMAFPRLRGPRLSDLAALAEFTPASTPFSPLVAHVPEPLLPAPRLNLHLKTPAAVSLFEDSGGALDRFYQSLWLTEKRQAITRIVHFGDSPTTADLITGDVRAMLQSRFGDAGHGFIFIAKPWAWYQHRGAEPSGSKWQMIAASHFEVRDGLYGLGGVSFNGSAASRSRIVFQEPQSRFELYFLRQPGGAAVTITAPGQPPVRIETQGEAKSAGFAAFEFPVGASRLELQPEGAVRLFGLTAERPGPGVVYDSLGLNGASVTVLSRIFNQQHLAEELRHRDPNLVIVNYGTNEADFAAFVDRQYEKELREAIRRIRSAVPQASILVMSPMDRGHRTGLGEIQTMDTIPRIVAIQKRVARETGCGFFDTFDAMGGEGTMARWYAAKPRLVSADLIHPYPAAGKEIAALFVREIIGGLVRFKAR